MFYISDLHGTPILARWFDSEEDAEAAAVMHGFTSYQICWAA